VRIYNGDPINIHHHPLRLMIMTRHPISTQSMISTGISTA
jgi:hypothetical protein